MDVRSQASGAFAAFVGRLTYALATRGVPRALTGPAKTSLYRLARHALAGSLRNSSPRPAPRCAAGSRNLSSTLRSIRSPHPRVMPNFNDFCPITSILLHLTSSLSFSLLSLCCLLSDHVLDASPTLVRAEGFHVPFYGPQKPRFTASPVARSLLRYVTPLPYGSNCVNFRLKSGITRHSSDSQNHEWL